jgi:peroxiredoxin Q/BCP
MEGTTPPEFELPNVSVGPDPLSLSEVAEMVDFAVLLLLRDYHCPKCKQQVQDVATRAEALSERNAAVIGILPEPRERAEQWEAEFDLPFPLLADAEKEVGDKYDQPTRFGAFGRLHDLIGRMPETVVLDVRDEPEIIHTHEGESASDRPSVDELLAVVDDIRESFAFDCTLVEC